ncbi:MAG: nucleoside triphosphate pyrophosphatase, partial [Lysobacterales bacterium]
MLLGRLGLPFTCYPPGLDEKPLPQEDPRAMVKRLAAAKAAAVSKVFPGSVIIGSDQLAIFDGRPVGKPGTHDRAFEQLASFSGRKVDFLTSVTVLAPETAFEASHTDCTSVEFRTLTDEDIRRYLKRDEPYDCAGSFKAEALGITLFERISSEDPTALLGLPLIRTA